MSEEISQEILEEASAWFVEFRAGRLSGLAREEFMAWLRRSPEHIRAYLDVAETYVRLPRSEEVSRAALERLLAKAKSREGNESGLPCVDPLIDGVAPIVDRLQCEFRPCD